MVLYVNMDIVLLPFWFPALLYCCHFGSQLSVYFCYLILIYEKSDCAVSFEKIPVIFVSFFRLTEDDIIFFHHAIATFQSRLSFRVTIMLR